MTKEERGEGDEESEEEVAKPTLKARMATFFRVNKGFSADEEKATPEETKENGDITKENGDAKTDMNKDEKEAEKEDEEQTTDETTEDKVIIEKEKTNKSYRSFTTGPHLLSIGTAIESTTTPGQYCRCTSAAMTASQARTGTGR